MRHSEFGGEPYELAAPLLLRHEERHFYEVNALPSPTVTCKFNDCSVGVPPIQRKKSAEVKPSQWTIVRKAFTYTSMWWVGAIIVIMTIKSVVSQEGIYPYPFAFTSFIQPATGLCAGLMSQAVYRKRPRPKKFEWREVGVLLLMGVMQGFEIGLTNKALEFMTVATRTMISSTNVLLMMCTARFWGLEHLGLLRVVSALLLVSGGCLQGIDQHMNGSGSQLGGVIMQVTSMMLSAQRWALAQFVLQLWPSDSALGQTSKLQLLARTLPLTGFVCIPLSLIFEDFAYTPELVFREDLVFRVFIVATALTAMSYAELKLVKLLSAVAFNVLATVHQIPIVLAGVVFQGNQVDAISGCGFLLCVVGALVYARARHRDRLAIDDGH